jgi:hypothetical protein
VEEIVVMVCIAVSRAEIVGNLIHRQRRRDRQRGKTSKARRILGKTWE